MRNCSLALVPVCLLLVVLSSGCGGDPLGRRAISGGVTVDGSPVEQGNVSFTPADQGTISAGAAITAGKYSVPKEGGLPPGKYRVAINAPKPGTGQAAQEGVLPGDPLPVPEELIPPEWNAQSQQFIEVSASGPSEFNFDIKTKK
jgi:hypothetical protein